MSSDLNLPFLIDQFDRERRAASVKPDTHLPREPKKKKKKARHKSSVKSALGNFTVHKMSLWAKVLLALSLAVLGEQA